MTLESTLNYTFRDPALLQAALTHPSATQKTRPKAGTGSPYERLEFVGDRVLGLIISHWLYTLFPDASEGILARRHAALVQRDQLASIAAERLNLLDHLSRAKTDEGDTRGHATILGDALEALIGAIYLDGGLQAAETVVRNLFADSVTAQQEAPRDPKTALQEWAQGNKHGTPIYKLLSQDGPSHAPGFIVEVAIGERRATGTGPSKQAAEKAAATTLFEDIGE